MNPPQPFAIPADVLADPVLLVAASGAVLAANRAAIEDFRLDNGDLTGRRLADLVANTPGTVADYLRRCSTTRQAVLGSLAFRNGTGTPTEYRCDGALVSEAVENAPAVICLQCRLKSSSNASFVALNDKIDQLAREVTMRRRAEARLKALLDEQEVLTKELHHRVKNNLQIIASLINLEATHAKDPETGESYRNLANRVRAMGLIHKQLYDLNEVSAINVASFIGDLAGNLEASYGQANVSVRIDAEDAWLSIESAVPLGLIINELVSNAFKHAFPGGRDGEIAIRLHAADQDRLELAVADNGCGIPAQARPRDRGSLGLTLVELLAQQLSASVQVTSENGTKYTLTWTDERKAPVGPA